MKILKLPTYSYPEQVSSSHLSKDLEEAYAKAGFETVMYAPTPCRGISEEERRKYKKIGYEERYDGKVKIHRFSMYKEPKNSLLRAIRYSLIQWKQYFRAIKEKDVDVLSSGSTPPTAGILMAKVKKKISKKQGREIPFVYNLQDVFPDSLVNTGITKKGSLLYKIGNRVAMYTYKNADKIIVISRDFKRMLIEKGIPEEKIELIYNWVDENSVTYVDRSENKLFDEYGIDRDKFYIAYSGNIGHTQNITMLLDVAQELKKYDKIGFILVGEGACRDEAEKTIKEKQLTNVKLLPFQPYERISEVFSLGDVGLLISKKGIGSNSVPSKTWSYLSAKRPVLASFDSDSELCDVIRENACGIVAEADDKEALKSAILSLAAGEYDLDGLGDNGRRFLTENISKETCTEKYVKLFESFEEKEREDVFALNT